MLLDGIHDELRLGMMDARQNQSGAGVMHRNFDGFNWVAELNADFGNAVLMSVLTAEDQAFYIA